MKATHPISLNVIQVRSPCPADWDEMAGNERVRFCGECKLHVYNLSALSRTAAEDLIAAHSGRLCVRYFQRPDGTILTQDCSWIRRAARRMRRRVMAVAGFALAVVLWIGGCDDSQKEKAPTSGPTTTTTTKPRDKQWISGATMGIVAYRPPPTTSPDNIAVMGTPSPSPATQPATQPADSSGSR